MNAGLGSDKSIYFVVIPDPWLAQSNHISYPDPPFKVIPFDGNADDSEPIMDEAEPRSVSPFRLHLRTMQAVLVPRRVTLR